MAQTAGGTYYAASSELVSSWPATSLDLANQLESRFAAKYTTGGAWTDYTPTLAQGATGNISKTIQYARYLQIGKLVVVTVRLDITGAGTANNGITVSLPVTAYGTNNNAFGSGRYNDGGVVYQCVVSQASSTTAYLVRADVTSAGSVGTDPNIATANGDSLQFTLTYEAA